jgi:arsenate reductase
MTLRIDLLTFANCPHVPEARNLAKEAVEALGIDAPIHEVVVESEDQAVSLGFPGSPTLRVNGRDVFPVQSQSTLACRVYPNGQGTPKRWRLEAALLRELRPRHILFLCVANSARSQLAEGIARSLAPSGVAVSSAGSEPSQVRPQAIRVLEEIGIDITSHRSKSVNDVDPSTVQAVITLCAEEVCPVFLGKAWRAHWGLPDPAAAKGTEEQVLDSFRGARDELRKRLTFLFDGWAA